VLSRGGVGGLVKVIRGGVEWVVYIPGFGGAVELGQRGGVQPARN
jgi:hypothetical protein